MQVAQAALTLLEVGLDDIATVAHPLVPRVAFGELVGDIGTGGAGDDVATETRPGRVVQGLIAPDVTRLQQRRADGQVGLRLADHLVERPRRVADLETEVPQEIQHGLDHLLAPRGLFPRRQEHDVDIGIRGHFAAAIAADRKQGQPLRRGRIGSGVQRGRGEIENQPQQLVGDESARRRCFQPARRVVVQAAAQFGAGIGQRGAQNRGGSVARAGPGGDRGEHVGKTTPVDQRTPVRNEIARCHCREIVVNCRLRHIVGPGSISAIGSRAARRLRARRPALRSR